MSEFNGALDRYFSRQWEESQWKYTSSTKPERYIWTGDSLEPFEPDSHTEPPDAYTEPVRGCVRYPDEPEEDETEEARIVQRSAGDHPIGGDYWP